MTMEAETGVMFLQAKEAQRWSAKPQKVGERLGQCLGLRRNQPRPHPGPRRPPSGNVFQRPEGAHAPAPGV